MHSLAFCLLQLLILHAENSNSFHRPSIVQAPSLLKSSPNPPHQAVTTMSSSPDVNPTAATKSRMAGWDERYAAEEFAFGTEPNDFLKETLTTLHLVPGNNKKCLLLADGEGRNGVYMAEQGYDAVSVDFSAAGLEKAQALAKTRNVKIDAVQADLADYDMGTEKWDCIVGIFCHFPPPVRAKVLAALPGSLKPGGHVIWECYTPDQLQYKTGGPPTAEPLYTKKLLVESLGDHLEVVRNEELVREVVEGKFHTGKAAVVQFIGKKKTG